MIAKVYTYRELVQPSPVLPKLYGIAYEDMWRGVVVAYPMPLNVFVRWGRLLYFYLKSPPQTKIEKREQDIYERAYADGLRRGIEKGM